MITLSMRKVAALSEEERDAIDSFLADLHTLIQTTMPRTQLVDIRTYIVEQLQRDPFYGEPSRKGKRILSITSDDTYEVLKDPKEMEYWLTQSDEEGVIRYEEDGEEGTALITELRGETVQVGQTTITIP